MKQLVGPPCLHCGLVTFTDRCNLMAYGLEETTIEGYALECFMCKSKGPWARTPEEAIQRYCPWVALEQRQPLENQNVVMWDRDACMGRAIRFSSELHVAGRYTAMHFTHWAPVAPDPSTYSRVTQELPEVQPPLDLPPSADTAEPIETPMTCDKKPLCWLSKGHEGECDEIPF